MHNKCQIYKMRLITFPQMGAEHWKVSELEGLFPRSVALMFDE